MTQVALIAACDRQRGIGKDGKLPWHLPRDLRHFKTLTLGGTVVMGRKTFESIGKPLPGRTNWILSRKPQAPIQASTVVSEPLVEHFLSPEDVLARADRDRLPTLWIIGGAEIYELFLPMATRIELTAVDADVNADVFFPPLDPKVFFCACESHYARDVKHPYSMTMRSLARVK